MKKLKLVTHSGRFHADETFATAVLSLLFEKTGQDFEVIRSRDPEIIKSGDIVYDNGVQYDPERKIFDHHQKGGAGKRENDVPYAAFGLIWKYYGQDLIANYFKDDKTADENLKGDEKLVKNSTRQDLTTENITQIAELIDTEVVQPIDASDTGYEDFRPEKHPQLRSYVPDSIAGSFNPTAEEGYDKAYDLFMQMVTIARQILERELIKAKAKIGGFAKVEQAYQEADDKRIIILDGGYSWKEILVAKPEPLFVVFPTIDGDGYMAQAVNEELTSYKIRKSFPESWRGKVNGELEKETGVEGSKFCHLAGFLVVAKTKEQVIELAKIAVES